MLANKKYKKYLVSGMGLGNTLLSNRFFPFIWGCGVCNIAVLMVLSSNTLVFRSGEPYVARRF